MEEADIEVVDQLKLQWKIRFSRWKIVCNAEKSCISQAQEVETKLNSWLMAYPHTLLRKMFNSQKEVSYFINYIVYHCKL